MVTMEILTFENVLIVERYPHRHGVPMEQVIICAVLVVYLIKSRELADPYHAYHDIW